ncbi:MAG: RsbRD N-terminal domain-containing protein, partial [bacterium]
IRAVQDLTAAQATSFIYLLKDVIDEVLGAEQPLEIHRALLLLYRKIDQLALLTFDTYMRCRDQVHQIRAGEKRKWGLQPGSAQSLPVLNDKEKRD